MPTEPIKRTGDCKSPIIGSIPIRASIPFGDNGVDNRNLLLQTRCDNNIEDFHYLCVISQFVQIPVNLEINYKKNITLRFSYKGKKFTSLLNCSLSELSEEDVYKIVKAKVDKHDNVVSLRKLCDEVVDNDLAGGATDTKKKNRTSFYWYLKQDGIDLDSSTKVLLQTDEFGRTLPERWQEEYKLPHKLRQIKSLFSRKNLLLFKRLGWDTSHFGNFTSFVAETTISQPFTTDDAEVERTIKFFNDNRLKHPIFYEIYLLAFGCGLRQSEIYQVRFEDFTTFGGQHFLVLPFATKRTKLKNLNHIEKVGISEKIYNYFVGQEKTGEIIKGGKRLHKRFISFLRNDLGMHEEVKCCHRLRKLLGARLASEHGIYHAAKTLRNSVGVAEKYYSDLTSHRNNLEV